MVVFPLQKLSFTNSFNVHVYSSLNADPFKMVTILIMTTCFYLIHVYSRYFLPFNSVLILFNFDQYVP